MRERRPQGMNAWHDVAVEAGMIIVVEPSTAVVIVIGSIAGTLPILRQCGRGCAQQQRHGDDKICCTHGSISRGRVSTACIVAIV